MNIHLKRVLILLLIFTFVFQMAGITSLQRVSAYADTEEALDAADIDQAEEEATAEDITDASEETITEEDPPEVTEEPAEDPEAVPEEPAEAEVVEEAPAAPETITVDEPAEEPAEAQAEAPALRAAGATKATKTGTVLAFTSDAHNRSGNDSGIRIGTWIDKVESKHGAIDVMAFGGDMGVASYSSGSDYWTYTQADMTAVSQKGVTGVYTTGNHEYSMGGDFSYSSYTNSSYSSTETKGQFKINTEGAEGDDYRIYCLGSVGSDNSYTSQVTALKEYLAGVGNSKPIFIITHFPLHKYGSRKTSGAKSMIDMLNDAAESGQTIVFLWGHNHTESDTYYDQIYGPGTTLPTNDGDQTIQFYYGAAGCMSDSENGTGSAYVKGKGLVVTITPNRGNATMNFTYYNEAGTDVTETSSDSVRSVDITLRSTASYVQTDELVAGQSYIIASEPDSDGNVLMLSNESTGTAKQLKGVSATVSNNTITISDEDVLSKVLFICEADSSSTLGGLQLQSGGKYLYSSSSDGLSMHTLDAGRSWYYKAYDGDTDKHILWLIKSTSADGWTSAGNTYKYYLDYSSGTYFTDQHIENGNTVQGTSGLPKIYLYTEAPEGETYTLSYDANGGTGSMSSQTNKTTYTVKSNSFTKEGYEFTKWNTKADGTGTDYEPGASITITEDTTLYAQWTKATTVDHTVYVLTNSLTVGKKYLVVNTNAATSANGAHAISNNNSAVADDPVTVNAGITLTNNTVYIDSDDVDTTTVWTVGGSSTSPTFSQGSSYLYPSSSGGVSISTTSRAWTAPGSTSSNHYLRYGSRTYYYLNYNNGWTTTSSSSSSTYQVYFYEETTIKVSITPGITVEPETATVGLGDTKTLTATPKNVEGTPTVIWSSDHPEYATVDQTGIVTGVAEGTATITASMTYEGETYTDTCVVTVAEIQNITYVLTDELVAGNQYLIANTNSGDAYVVSNEANGTGTLKGVSVSIVDGTITIPDTVAVNTAFSCELEDSSDENSTWLMMGTQSLYTDSSSTGGLRIDATKTGRYWHYKAYDGDTDKHLLWFYNGTNDSYGYTASSGNYRYYLQCSDGNFTSAYANSSTLGNTSTPKMYLFVKSVPVTGIELDKTTESVAVGNTVQLNATVAPATATNKTVNWTSSDESKATVDNTGKVTGVAEGEVTITATTADGGYTATCTVTVSVVHVTDVTLDASASVAVGGKIQLTPTITPENASNKNVSWSSSAPGIATVDNDGKVTGVAEGEAVITVTTDDGNKTAACTVTVTKQKTYVIVINNHALSTEVSTDQYVQSSNYKYNGLVGVEYNSDTVITDNIRWIITETTSGYYIQSLDGRYLKATYEATTNPSGCNANLILETISGDATPDVWVLDEGIDLEGWKVEGSHLKSTNASNSSTSDKYLSEETGTNNTSLFSIRSLSNSDTSTLEEVTDYTLSYNANASDVTGTTADQTGSSSYTVSNNGFTREGYVFQKWNTKADGSGTNYAPGESITLTEDTTLYAQWVELCATHTYGTPVWTWANDYTSATATFTCSVCGTVETLTDNQIDVQTATGDCQTPVGATTYTASVTLDGVDYSDEQSVGGSATVKVTSAEANGEYVLAYYDGSKYYVVQHTSTSSSTPAVVQLDELASDNVTDSMLWIAEVSDSGFKLKNKNTSRYIYSQQGSVTTGTSVSYYFSFNESDVLVYVGRNSNYYYSISSEGALQAPTTDPGTGNLCLYEVGAAQYGPHSYGFQGFTWTDNTAVANYKCSVCNDTKSVNAAVEKTSSTPATCDDPAYDTYTATISAENSLDGQPRSDIKTLVATENGGAGYAPVEAASSGDFVLAYYDGSMYHVLKYANSSLSVADLTTLNAETVDNTMLWTSSGSSAFSLKNKGASSNIYLYYGGSGDGMYASTNTSARAYFYFADGKLYYYNTSSQSSVANKTLYFYYSNGSVLISNDVDPGSGYIALYAYSEGTEVPSTPLGHDWDYDNIAWSWTGSDAAGWTAATATLTCKRDNSHTTTVNAVVTSETEGNTTTYTATITEGENTYTDEKVVTGHEHSYVISYVWASDNSTCTATATCSGCNEGDEGHIVTAEATVSYEVITSATCTTVGSGTYTATFENELFETQTKSVDIPAAGHTMSHHNAVAPTCTEAGTVEYWSCSNCGKNFSDEAGTTELTSIVDPKTGHDMTHHAAVAATCTEDGTVEYWSCSNCGKNFSDVAGTTELTSIVDPKTGHDMTHHAAVAPTCTEDGTVEYWSCGNCEKNFSDAAGTNELTSLVYPKTGHNWNAPTYTWADDNSKVTASRTCKNDTSHVETEIATTTYAVITEPTETTAGVGRYTSEAFENAAFTVQTKDIELPPTGYVVTYEWLQTADGYSVKGTAVPNDHGAETIIETVGATYAVTKEATCTETGIGTWTSAAFTNSQFAVQTKEVPIPATGHSVTHHDAVSATCTEAGNVEYWSCPKCNKNFSDEAGTTALETVVVQALGHHMTAHEAVEATCTTDGNSAYWSCDRCNKYFSDADGNTEIEADSWVITAFNHDWNEPTYEWAANYTSVTATRTCKNDSTHVETETVAATGQVSTPATCTQNGVKIWTSAEFTNAAFKVQRTTEALPATGHDWNEPTYVWAADHTSVTATRTCKNDAEHVETDTAAATSEVTKAATCTEAGVRTWTSAAFSNNAFAAQTATEEIPATGHKWIKPATWTWTGDDENGYTKVGGTFTCQNDPEHVQLVETTEITSVKVDPTPTTAGSITYTAELTGPNNVVYEIQKEVTLPATGYTYKDPVYTWTETSNGYSVTALKECNEDPAQNISETVTASYAVTTPAKCETDGVGTYTASFTNSAFETKTKEVVISATGHTPVTDAAVAPTCTETGLTEGSHCSVCGKVLTAQETVAALGHDWNVPTCVWNADHTSVTATFTCKRDASHTDTATASGSAITSEVTTEPTATAPGERTYTATVTFDGETYTLTDTEAIPATGTSVSGNITSFVGNTEEGQVTVELFADGSETAAYTATVSGNTSYAFEGVADGTYTMKVSKKDHVTRSYDITVAGSAVTQDVKIHLLGDINGDGAVTTVDAARVNSHAKGKTLLTGYEFSCGDINGDGSITTIDAARTNSHAKGKTLLW